LKHLKTI